jgi:ferredoxin
MKGCGCCEEIADVFRMLTEHIRKMSAREKALLRIQLRKDFKLPPMPEPDAWRQ